MISIIIPTYNNADFLDRCLRSIAQQTYNDYEVLIVDDGSTDNTSEICVPYCSKDQRFIYLKKENGGVSSARNYGLDHFKGDYIIFVDSDDFLKPEALATINKDVTEHPDIDIVIYGNYLMTSAGTSLCQNDSSFDSIGNLALETIERLSPTNNEWLRTIWAKAYRRSVLENLRFPFNVYIGQDACFFVTLLNTISGIDRIMMSNDSWYVYDRTNEQSATHNYKKDLYILSKLQLDYLVNQLIKFKDYDPKRRDTVFAKFCWNLFWIMYYQGQMIKRNNNCFKWYSYCKDYINKNDIYKVEFADNLADKTFKYRKILANPLIFKIVSIIYEARKRN